MERILADLVSQTSFVVRRDVLSFVGGAFKVNNPLGEPIFYVKVAFNFRGDLHFLDGQNKKKELMVVSPRRAFDNLAIYDIVDTGRQERVGAVQRKPQKHILTIWDRTDREVGSIVKNTNSYSMAPAYRGVAGSVDVCFLKQHFNPVLPAMTAEFSLRSNPADLDRRLFLAGILLVCTASGV